MIDMTCKLGFRSKKNNDYAIKDLEGSFFVIIININFGKPLGTWQYTLAQSSTHNCFLITHCSWAKLILISQV